MASNFQADVVSFFPSSSQLESRLDYFELAQCNASSFQGLDTEAWIRIDSLSRHFVPEATKVVRIILGSGGLEPLPAVRQRPKSRVLDRLFSSFRV